MLTSDSTYCSFTLETTLISWHYTKHGHRWIFSVQYYLLLSPFVRPLLKKALQIFSLALSGMLMILTCSKLKRPNVHTLRGLSDWICRVSASFTEVTRNECREVSPWAKTCPFDELKSVYNNSLSFSHSSSTQIKASAATVYFIDSAGWTGALTGCFLSCLTDGILIKCSTCFPQSVFHKMLLACASFTLDDDSLRSFGGRLAADGSSRRPAFSWSSWGSLGSLERFSSPSQTRSSEECSLLCLEWLQQWEYQICR